MPSAYHRPFNTMAQKERAYGGSSSGSMGAAEPSTPAPAPRASAPAPAMPKPKKKKKPAVRAPKPQGRGIVKALGQKGTTGNFARIEAEKGKGAAIGALQNKLAKRRGEPIPYKGGK